MRVNTGLGERHLAHQARALKGREQRADEQASEHGRCRREWARHTASEAAEAARREATEAAEAAEAAAAAAAAAADRASSPTRRVRQHGAPNVGACERRG